MWYSLGKFMFMEWIEENQVITEQQHKRHFTNSIFKFSASQAPSDDCTKHVHQWRRSGVLQEDLGQI
jgi:guanylate kinase